MLLAREQLLVEEGRREGIAEGRREGISAGREKERTLLVKNALKDCTPENVSKLLGIPLHEVLKIAHDV